jgi:formylglycine-generating enzyme required for sulfatase activity
MLLIPAGTFMMGSPPTEPGRNSWGTREAEHEVTLTKPFHLCEHEVTQAEWSAVMSTHPSHFAGDNLPVERVSWFDAIEYCNQRSAGDGLIPVYTLRDVARNDGRIVAAIVSWNRGGNGYRLPTEAEWEYACRAGSTSAFCNGSITHVECSPLDQNLDQVGWYCGNSSARTHEVGGKAPNEWGLKDMHGNVREWCWDRYGEYRAGPLSDPAGPAWGSTRVFRGGQWSYHAQYCRSADRLEVEPTYVDYNVGFRVARNTQ